MATVFDYISVLPQLLYFLLKQLWPWQRSWFLIFITAYYSVLPRSLRVSTRKYVAVIFALYVCLLAWEPRYYWGWDDPQKYKLAESKLHNTDCPRVVSLYLTEVAGMGHKLTEVLLGLALAQALNATYVFDDLIWKRATSHGTYEWFTDVLALQTTELTLSEWNAYWSQHWWTIRHVHSTWDGLLNTKAKHPKNKCHVYFTSTLDRFCHVGQKECGGGRNEIGIGLYDRFKWKLRSAYRPQACQGVTPRTHGNVSKPDDNHPVTVAWHVRGGDIRLNNFQQYFDRLASQLVTVATLNDNWGDSTRLPLHVMFIGENVEEQFPFLPHTCRTILDGRCSYPILGPKESLCLLMQSDVLITSGSNFASVAAVLKTNGLVLNAFSKDGVRHFYEVAEQGLIDMNGTITKPSLEEFRHRMGILYEQKMR